MADKGERDLFSGGDVCGFEDGEWEIRRDERKVLIGVNEEGGDPTREQQIKNPVPDWVIANCH